MVQSIGDPSRQVNYISLKMCNVNRCRFYSLRGTTARGMRKHLNTPHVITLITLIDALKRWGKFGHKIITQDESLEKVRYFNTNTVIKWEDFSLWKTTLTETWVDRVHFKARRKKQQQQQKRTAHKSVCNSLSASLSLVSSLTNLLSSGCA